MSKPPLIGRCHNPCRVVDGTARRLERTLSDNAVRFPREVEWHRLKVLVKATAEDTHAVLPVRDYDVERPVVAENLESDIPREPRRLA